MFRVEITASEFGYIAEYLNDPRIAKAWADSARQSEIEAIEQGALNSPLEAVSSTHEFRRAEMVSRKLCRMLVEEWMDSGKDISTWGAENGNRYHLYELLGRAVKKYRPFLMGSHLLIALRHEIDPVRNAEVNGAVRFLQFIRSEEAKRFGKCVRCRRFFIQQRARSNSKYCSQKCGSAMTAALSMQRSRRAEHRRRLQATRETLELMKMASPKAIKRTLKSREVSPNFLTRAIKNGELQDIAADLIRLKLAHPYRVR